MAWGIWALIAAVVIACAVSPRGVHNVLVALARIAMEALEGLDRGLSQCARVATDYWRRQFAIEARRLAIDVVLLALTVVVIYVDILLQCSVYQSRALGFSMRAGAATGISICMLHVIGGALIGDIMSQNPQVRFLRDLSPERRRALAWALVFTFVLAAGLAAAGGVVRAELGASMAEAQGIVQSPHIVRLLAVILATASFLVAAFAAVAGGALPMVASDAAGIGVGVAVLALQLAAWLARTALLTYEAAWRVPLTVVALVGDLTGRLSQVGRSSGAPAGAGSQDGGEPNTDEAG